MSVVTRKGDAGDTDLLFGKRVRKTSVRIRSLGALDVAMASLGMLKVEIADTSERALIEGFQDDLRAIMGWVAVSASDMEVLGGRMGAMGLREDRYNIVDGLAGSMDTVRFGWATTGEDRVLALYNLARTFIRVAEVSVWEVVEESAGFGELSAKYLNRLSDLLWLMARERERK